MEIEIIPGDLKKELHRVKLVELLAAYMLDDMGGNEIMPPEIKKNLAQTLANHPTTLILFALADGEFVGIATCYTNISTFKAKPYFNVHDVAVLPDFRGKGVGKKLLERVIEIARERDYCKVSLEVRVDNEAAKHLYSSLGFVDSDPVMHFWTKKL